MSLMYQFSDLQSTLTQSVINNNDELIAKKFQSVKILVTHLKFLLKHTGSVSRLGGSHLVIHLPLSL